MRMLNAFIPSFVLLNTFVFLSSPAVAEDSYMLTPNQVCRAFEEPYKSEFNNYTLFPDLETCLDEKGANLPNSPAGLREKAQMLRNKPYEPFKGLQFQSESGQFEGFSSGSEGGAGSNTNVLPLMEDRFELLSNQKAQDIVEEKESLEEADAQEDFEKFRLGIGIAFTKLHDESIDDVDIRDNRIVISKEREHRGSFMLETHKFFTFNRLSLMFPDSHKVGVGPFISVSVADTEGSDPFSAYGVGLMMGFKDRKGSGSWNIGFGYFVDTKAKKLSPGIKAGDTTTVQNTDDLLVERDQGGVMVIVSTSWD